MKITLISWVYPKIGGGAEVSIHFLYEALIRQGHNINIITASSYNEKSKNIYPLRWGKYLPTSQGTRLTDYFFYKSIKDILKKNPPEIIHVQDFSWLLPSSIKAANELNIPIVATVRNYQFICNLGCTDASLKCDYSFKKYLHCLEEKIKANYNLPLLSLMMMPLLYPRRRIFLDSLYEVDAITPISDFVKKELVKNGIDENKIFTLYNIAPNWEEINIKKESNKMQLLSAGRIKEEKGFHILINAMKHVIKENKNVELIIAGEGPYRQNLEKLVYTLNLNDYVFFAGKVGFKEIKEYYFKSDIVVFPSIGPEAFGRISIEAMVAGKPVIASRVGSIPEIVEDGKTGLLVEPANVKELATAIIMLLKNEELRKRMGEEGRKIAKQKFNADVIVKKLIKVYMQTLRRFNDEGR